MKTDFTKLRTKVLGIVEGLSLADNSYYALRRLISYAEKIHCNERKDGSPEFSHQLEMLALALTFHESLSKPREVYMAIIAHDLLEDYPEMALELQELFPETVQYSNRLAKEPDHPGLRTYHKYFRELSECEVCSVVKLIDRVHNLSTAPGVFTDHKLHEYCDEVDAYFLDLIKVAKEQFAQRSVYETLKFMLNTQVHTIRALCVKPDPTAVLMTPKMLNDVVPYTRQTMPHIKPQWDNDNSLE